MSFEPNRMSFERDDGLLWYAVLRVGKRLIVAPHQGAVVMEEEDCLILDAVEIH